MVAIDLITQHIRMKLQQPDLRRIYHSLELIPSNYQIRGMHTILRDQKTNKTDFIFIADRLLRLVRTYFHDLHSQPCVQDRTSCHLLTCSLFMTAMASCNHAEMHKPIV